ncbi:MAG: HD domain-containing protein [Oscillospiraceae bacterium]|jgi:metal-dependent HD superfamily phosphatase/phosphodiesterase|nr:HD domain-containing protein [Oscillospiraceae bacterium]
MLTFSDIQSNEEINTYIRQADESLKAMGFTEHAFAHSNRCAGYASEWLLALGYSEKEARLARIAGYMHDIGNVVNRYDHAQSGAVLAFGILSRLEMPPDELAAVVTAIGNHDEATAHPVNSVAAALILADKTDVRRTRVRNAEISSFDIHDRVNYAVRECGVTLDIKTRSLTLELDVDTEICQVLDYFEIFMGRMLLCRRAADFLGLRFRLVINGSALM